MLMLERNNRRKKLFCPLVYGLVVEINIQTNQNKNFEIIWSIHSVRCVPSEHKGGKGFGGCMSQLKLQGGQSHLKGVLNEAGKLVAFHETRVKGNDVRKALI